MQRTHIDSHSSYFPRFTANQINMLFEKLPQFQFTSGKSMMGLLLVTADERQQLIKKLAIKTQELIEEISTSLKKQELEGKPRIGRSISEEVQTLHAEVCQQYLDYILLPLFEVKESELADIKKKKFSESLQFVKQENEPVMDLVFLRKNSFSLSIQSTESISNLQKSKKEFLKDLLNISDESVSLEIAINGVMASYIPPLINYLWGFVATGIFQHSLLLENINQDKKLQASWQIFSAKLQELTEQQLNNNVAQILKDKEVENCFVNFIGQLISIGHAETAKAIHGYINSMINLFSRLKNIAENKNQVPLLLESFTMGLMHGFKLNVDVEMIDKMIAKVVLSTKQFEGPFVADDYKAHGYTEEVFNATLQALESTVNVNPAPVGNRVIRRIGEIPKNQASVSAEVLPGLGSIKGVVSLKDENARKINQSAPNLMFFAPAELQIELQKVSSNQSASSAATYATSTSSSSGTDITASATSVKMEPEILQEESRKRCCNIM